MAEEPIKPHPVEDTSVNQPQHQEHQTKLFLSRFAESRPENGDVYEKDNRYREAQLFHFISLWFREFDNFLLIC